MSDMISKRDIQVSPDQIPLVDITQSVRLGSSQPNSLLQPTTMGTQPTSLPLTDSIAEDVNPVMPSQPNMFKLQRGRSK